MTHNAVMVCAVIAVAAGGVATTIARARIFEGLRLFVVRRSFHGGLLVNCPYCAAHWLVFAGIAVYLMSGASAYHSGDLFIIDGAYSLF